MLNFFRRIRRRFLEQDNLKKYLIYAFGEIILITIGILLAFQINNWNDNRIKKKEEKAYLASLVEDLEQEVFRFRRNMVVSSYRMKAINTILKVLDYSEEVNRDSLEEAISLSLIITAGRTISLNEAEIQGNLSKIRSEKIKDLITDYYLQLDELSNFERRMISDFFTEDLLPFYYQNLNVNKGLSRFPELSIWEDSKIWEGQENNIESLNVVDLPEVPFWNYPKDHPKKLELVNLLSEYYVATDLAKISYENLHRKAKEIINSVKGYH